MAAVADYLLIVDTVGRDDPDHEPGQWRFVLQVLGGDVELDITDVEPDVRGERLELLTIVRGLEALDQPSHVTVLTSSRYVRNGIEQGLSQWRAQGWLWESFGRLEPVKHVDLWQRFDRAASIHEVRCARLARPSRRDARAACSTTPQRRFDSEHDLARQPRPARRGIWKMMQSLVGA